MEPVLRTEIAEGRGVRLLHLIGPRSQEIEGDAVSADARPKALQIALLVPLIAGLLGLITAFRVVRLRPSEPALAS